MRECWCGPAAGRGVILMLVSALLAGGWGPAGASGGSPSDAPPFPVADAAPTPPIPNEPPPAAAYLAVPLDSPLYDDLEHFRALGLWRGSLEMRPIRRQVFTRAAASIRSAAAGRRLSSRDEVRLRRLETVVAAWEAHRATSRAPATGQPVAAAPGVAESGDDPPARAELSLSLNLVGNASDLDSLVNLDRRSSREQLVMVSLDAAAGAAAFLQWRAYEDYDRLTPFRRGDRWSDNLPVNPRGVLTSPSARNDRAVIGAGWRWGDVRFGREDRHWGTGRQGTLFLSENPFPLDGVSARFQTRFLAGSSLLAQRRRGHERAPVAGQKADTLATVTTGDAWLAAHRIELRPPGPVRLGLYEAVAWSGRGIDLAYANPASFLVAVTQDLFDRAAASEGANIDDKKVIGLDFAADVAPVSLYGEFLVNRIVTLDAGQGPNSEATTWAQLVGLRLANPLGLAGADLDLEYAHLDPEVYFHKDRDPGLAFLSEGELLGHWLGPNADSFRARLAMPIGARLGTAALSFDRSRWGVIDGRRGTELGFFSLRKGDKHWITGRVAEERVLAVEWRHEASRLPAGVVLDAETRLARVERSGMHQRDGWQAELRLTCRAAVQVGE